MNTVISLIGLIAVFAMAYGFDQWAVLVQRLAKENFNLMPYFWFLSITNLALASSVSALAWFVCFRTNKRWLISAVFLVVGLFVTFAFAITHTFPIFLPPNSRGAYVSAFVIVIGFARLLLSKND
jgi:hypothetical protein